MSQTRKIKDPNIKTHNNSEAHKIQKSKVWNLDIVFGLPKTEHKSKVWIFGFWELTFDFCNFIFCFGGTLFFYFRVTHVLGIGWGGGLATNRDMERQAELHQFQWREWPVLTSGEWQLRYYDTLGLLNDRCLEVASQALRMLAHLNVKQVLPARTNLHRQVDSCSCGLWILHYIEEEARTFLGELPATRVPDLQNRYKKVNAMVRYVFRRTLIN